MTPTEDRVLEHLGLFSAAIGAFGDAVRGAGLAVRRFCWEFDYRLRLQNARTPRERRRLMRDWQRHNRRPALIHKGGRPR